MSDGLPMSQHSPCPSGAPGQEEEDQAASGEEELAICIERLSLAPSSRKKLLVVDVNNLLVHAVFCSGSEALSLPNSREPDFVVGRKLVFKRPFCDDFLRFCFDKFHVAIWSSAMRKNVMGIIECAIGSLAESLLFIWDQSKCTDTGFKTIENRNKPLFLKELKKLWDERSDFSAKNTLLVDDTPYKALLNPPNNAIFPCPYDAAMTEDTELGPEGEIRSFLEGLAAADEVPSYVAAHPLGQEAIAVGHPDWGFYSRVVSRLSPMVAPARRSRVSVV